MAAAAGKREAASAGISGDWTHGNDETKFAANELADRRRQPKFKSGAVARPLFIDAETGKLSCNSMSR